MKRLISGGLSIAATLVILTISIGPGATPAAAALPDPCKGWNTGYLCAFDRSTPSRALNVKDNNAWWGANAIGSEWNDRTDDFYNGGKSCKAGVYEHIDYGYSSSSGRLTIARGESVIGWYDKASSNKWIC